MRALAVFVLAAVVLACAGAAAGARGGVPTCQAANLGTWYGTQQGAAGTILAPYAFVNKGSSACSLIGFPKVAMLDSSGQPIATTDTHYRGFAGITRKLVVLAPGRRAYFGVLFPDFTGAGQATCPTAAALALTPPGSSQAVTLTGGGAEITPYAGSHLKIGCGYLELTLVTAKGRPFGA
jgi:hypothetical protein